MQWHLYCRVVDNFGDVGVAWRLAADLAGRGERVRLFVDDASALAWMAPGGAQGVEVAAFDAAAPGPADVVVELFGAGVPADAARSGSDAVWIDVEHLSAESYAERSHGLPSPHGDDGTTWFFFPGFSAASGGLIREPGLLEARKAFDEADGMAWLASLGIAARASERRVSLFCYDNDALPGLINSLAEAPTLLLVTPGFAADQARAELGPAMARGRLRAVALPLLSQAGYDRLLWSCDLNVVRGEDSLVRAVWAGAPFVWQLYRQDDGAHHVKRAAFLARLLAGAPPDLAARIEAMFARWNGGGSAPAAWDGLDCVWLAAWRRHCERWRDGLADQADLGTRLVAMARSNARIRGFAPGDHGLARRGSSRLAALQ